MEKDSTDWQVNAFLGEISIEEGNDSIAIVYFQNASQLAPWNPQLWNRVGILLFESQRYEETVVEMKNAISKFPDDFVDNLILVRVLPKLFIINISFNLIISKSTSNKVKS